MSVSDPSATINYVRDNLGRATTIQNILGTFIGQQFTFHQSFNAVDQRTELRAVHGIKNDFRNTYAYDNLRRLTQIVQTGQTGSAPVVDKRVSFEYNTQGLRSKLSRFESTSSARPVATTDYLYDSTKRLTGIAHKQGTTNLNTYSLIYDDMHRITSITSTLDGRVDFDYDQRSQLTSVIDTTAGGGYNDVSQTLAYDQRGNRTGTGYTVNSDNRLTAAPNGVGMTYDNEGNLKTVTSNGSTQKRFEWDHRNRLTRVSIGNADWVTYEYDAFNRMVKRTQSGTFNTTYFAYDEGINPLLQWESNDSRLSLSHRYLWSDSVDELLADEQFLAGMTAPNTKWALSDHQGTIKDIVDYNPATGVATVDRHRKYDSFGDRRGAALPTDIVFGYTGKYFDEVTGLQNNWNRWYDPKQGRFISQDPIGFAGGDENLYRYVGNDVTNATDPTGLWKGNKRKGRQAELGTVSGYFAELSNHYHSSNPLAHIYYGMLVGPVSLFDTLPNAIADSARYSREDIISTINITNDPVQKFAGYAALPINFAGEGFAQFGNSIAASAPLLPAANVPLVATILASRRVSYTLGALGTYNSISVGIEHAREGSFSGSDVTFIAMSMSPFAFNRRAIYSTAADAPVSEVMERGGLNLFKWKDPTSTTATGWREGDRFLYLPNQGGAKANWAQNSSRLRQEMQSGEPIFDSFRKADGTLKETTGFLNAERNLLQNRGWTYNPSTGAWHPPVGN
jgi:RHS repeat-associated protein